MTRYTFPPLEYSLCRASPSRADPALSPGGAERLLCGHPMVWCCPLTGSHALRTMTAPWSKQNLSCRVEGAEREDPGLKTGDDTAQPGRLCLSGKFSICREAASLPNSLSPRMDNVYLVIQRIYSVDAPLQQGVIRSGLPLSPGVLSYAGSTGTANDRGRRASHSPPGTGRESSLVLVRPVRPGPGVPPTGPLHLKPAHSRSGGPQPHLSKRTSVHRLSRDSG